jgi:hypothetical protein
MTSINVFGQLFIKKYGLHLEYTQGDFEGEDSWSYIPYT